ncbi:hypothetical protein [Actinocorallia aurantiaca]|uniref:DUF4878 domain-containing protein n=1 Tax=Actinocorallia aurantiaca TaxID=46204 RepID=A0ABP6HA29_9ACTN
MTDASNASSGNPRNKWLLIGGVLFAILLVAGLAIALFSGRGPTETTERFLEAAQDRDRAAVRSLSCAKNVNSIAKVVEEDENLIEWKIISEKVSGDAADVIVSITLFENGSTGTSAGTFGLVKENGDWKVCDLRQ